MLNLLFGSNNSSGENSSISRKKVFNISSILLLNVDIAEGEKFLKNNPNKKEAHKLKDQIIQLNRYISVIELCPIILYHFP